MSPTQNKTATVAAVCDCRTEASPDAHRAPLQEDGSVVAAVYDCREKKISLPKYEKSRPAPLAESSELHGPQSITNPEASGSNYPFPPPISPKPQMARMRKKVRGKVRGKPMTKSLLSLANRQVFPFHKWPRF